MTYVIDAHALIWFVIGDARLGPAAAAAMRDASAHLVVPTIALAEIHHADSRGRSAASSTAVRVAVAALANAAIYPFDAAVLDRLPTDLELHDAIIVATTLVFRDGGSDPVRLITHDRQIAASGLVDVVW